jgi:hypothetical protein
MIIKKGKKAQEQVITAVLIILLVIAAVAIVWRLVDNMVRTGEDQAKKATECIKVKLQPVSATASNDIVTVTRLGGGNENSVYDLKFLINGIANSRINVTSGGIEVSSGNLTTFITKSYTLSPGFNDGDSVDIMIMLDKDTPCEGKYTITAVS